MRYRLAAGVALLTVIQAITSSALAEFSMIIEQEIFLDESLNAQKYELTLQPEWTASITNNTDMTFIGKIRADALDNISSRQEKPENYAKLNGPLTAGSHGEISIREWYIDTEIQHTFWRIGKQQVVWGQADGLKILDVINPQNFSEFILDEFEDSRIPLWMLNVEIPTSEESSLQILWIPDLTYHEFAAEGTIFRLSSPLFVPKSNIVQLNTTKPDSVLSDSDIGLRYSTFYNGWDLNINYLYHYLDSPVLYQQQTNTGVIINSEYERNHLVGASASNVFGDFTLRTEVGYNENTFHLKNSPSVSDEGDDGIFKSPEIASVIGLDWQGLTDIFISVQWFQSHLFDYDQQLVRPQNNHIASLLFRQTFLNESLELNLLSLYGFELKDSSSQLELSYLLEDNLKLRFGFDHFSGDKNGLFGQFNNQSLFKLGFEWGL